MLDRTVRTILILCIAMLGVARVAAAGSCPAGYTEHTIDFELDDELAPLSAGDIFDGATQHFAAYGVTFSVDLSMTTCTGPLMIFDSANVTGMDDDLGSENSGCGGPGIGAAGAPGATFENCAGEDNILILSEDGVTADPDDCGNGTTFIDIDFDYVTTICEASSLDVDTLADRPTLEMFDGADMSLGSRLIGSTETDPADYGDNALVPELGLDDIGPQLVRRLRITMPGSGSLPEVTFCRDDSFTPVTLGRFEATDEGGATRFDWSTATEIQNAGFHIYAQSEDGWQPVNEQLIPSRVIDSTESQDYSLTVAGLAAQSFVLVDVDLRGKETVHGPFGIGRSAGSRDVAKRTDWRKLRAASAAERGQWAPAARPRRRGRRGAKRYGAMDLRVSTEGVHRVSHEQLKQAGVDFTGVPARRLALMSAGRAVPRLIEGGPVFGPGSAVEFYGFPLDTLYTDTNVYTLRISRRAAIDIQRDRRLPDPLAAAPGHYMETTQLERNNAYSFAAPNGDPWYDTAILAYTVPTSKAFEIELDQLAARGPEPELNISMWGTTAWPQPLDHHVQARFNSRLVADERFDGQVDRPVAVELPAGALVEGTNILELSVMGDTGPPWDIVTFEGFEVTYPRRFVARGDGLRFSAAGPVFRVDGLPGPDFKVYRLVDDRVARLEGAQSRRTPEGYQALFPGSEGSVRYVVATAASIRTPELSTRRLLRGILSDRADELFVTHPDFLASAEELAAAHRGRGLEVKVVTVDDVYAAFSSGVVDAEAIRRYIRRAARRMGVTSVLLIGGDSYDYRDHLGQGAVSFVPSLYAATGSIVRWTPADPLYADVNDDGVPDLELGRLPVRTPEELRLLIDKTLRYPGTANNSLVFAADSVDGSTSFSEHSEQIAAGLPAGWDVERAYIDELGLEGARSQLFESLNAGVSVASFFGHSSPSRWTFQGLFDGEDAASLTNFGRPTVVAQWGCWSTYYVSPTYDSMGHRFLLSGQQGAAAVLGAATLTRAASDRALAALLMPRLLQPGMTVGRALLEAKQELARQSPGRKDVLLGFTLLGDPQLVVGRPGAAPLEAAQSGPTLRSRAKRPRGRR